MELKTMSLMRRSSKYLDQISLRRVFHHVGMWFTTSTNSTNVRMGPCNASNASSANIENSKSSTNHQAFEHLYDAPCIYHLQPLTPQFSCKKSPLRDAAIRSWLLPLM